MKPTNLTDTELLNNLFENLCADLNKIYNQYINKYDLHSEQLVNSPFNKDMCHNVRDVLQINYIADNTILRLNFQSQLLNLRAKCIYNQSTNISFINIIDFQIHKIQMRGGGFGTKLLEIISNNHKNQVKLKHDQYPASKILIMQYYSIPFQIKNGFKFKWLADINDPDVNHQNVTYKFFKLIILLNQVQNLSQYVENFDLFSFEEHNIDDLLKRWLFAYYNTNYHNNLQIRARLLDGFGSKIYEGLEVPNSSWYNAILYNNILNQLSNDRLSNEYGILQILHELFLLEKKIGDTNYV